MTRLETVRVLAEMRAAEQARDILDSVMRVDLPLLEHDDHPTIPDPTGWTGPCAERRVRAWFDEAGRGYYVAPGAVVYTDGI